MSTLPIETLRTLRLMEEYFEPENAVMFEADLIEAHGQADVWQAIDDGIIEHRRLPFRDGHERCICWLTDKGRNLADNA
jgi:hypothetical protein